MDAPKELQVAPGTSLRPRDVMACPRLKLRDPVAQKMVGYLEEA